MIKIIRYTIVVVITLMVLLLLWQFSIAIVLFLLSLAVAAALRPSINGIMERRVPKWLALGIVYFLLITGIVGSLLLISQPLFDELERATNDFVANYERAKVEWPLRGTLFQQTLAEQLPPAEDLYQALTTESGIRALTGFFGIAQDFFSILGRIAIVIVLSLYWSVDQSRFERLGLSLLPKEYHARALGVWRSVENGVGSYLRSEIIQSVLAGLLLWLGYSVLGIRFPVLLAIWGAIVRLIPWLGALIAVLPALLLGIGTSTILGILATIYTIGILLALILIVEPRFFPRYKYSSLLTVLFVVALAESFGFIGVVLAPLLAVAVQILFQNLYPAVVPTFPIEISQQAISINKRLLELKRRVQNSHNRENMRLIGRLHSLAHRTNDYIQEY
jgi:putative permease